eukprot:jgi/Orpsp1_1/1181041/evm.model.c7180000075597.1
MKMNIKSILCFTLFFSYSLAYYRCSDFIKDLRKSGTNNFIYDNECENPNDNAELITTMSLINNKITTIPKEISVFKNLYRLELDKNQIRNVAKEISLLTNLNDFHLNENGMSTIPKEVFSNTSVEYLMLYENKITTLPKEVGNMKNLIF